ncbi:MAG: hypothetical protein KAR33_00650, partial [Candidatus Thorarchaeota archaeon]|nr:hypothetical protein [Candidatus Thorarchaeota archaeon]
MEISFLPSDYVINVVKEDESKTVNESIFLIKALRIRNSLEKSITIKKLHFNLKSGGVSRKEIIYSKEVLTEKAERLKGLLGAIGIKQDSSMGEATRIANAHFVLGQESFWEYAKFTSNHELEPGQEIGYRLEVFRLVSPQTIDEIECTVTYEVEKNTKKETLTIPVKTY